MKTLLLLFLLSGMAQANSLQQLDLYKSTAVYRVSGKIAVAASSSTYSTFTITMDGTNGISTTKPIVTTSTMTAGFYGDIVANYGNFTNSTATNTIVGYLDIGAVYVSTTLATSTEIHIECPRGTYILHGGCKTSSSLSATQSANCTDTGSTGHGAVSCNLYGWPFNAWDCGGIASGTMSAYAVCVRLK
jgi:hypothetical protein